MSSTTQGVQPFESTVPSPSEFAVEYGIRNRRVFRRVKAASGDCEQWRPHVTHAPNPQLAWWMSYLRKDELHAEYVRDVHVLDLFSSVGGLSLGVSEAIRALGGRPQILAGVDVDANALGVFSRNHQPFRTINTSVARLVDSRPRSTGSEARFAYSPEALGELTHLPTRPDVIVAGPPCQGHSTLNNHTRGRDEKNDLYLTVPGIAVALNVPVVIIENVPNVVNDKRGVVVTARALLESAGYTVTQATLSAHHLGWPQTRKRFFMVATKGHSPIDLEWLKKEFRQPEVGVEWAINDLAGIPLGGTIMTSVPELSDDNRRRIDFLVSSGQTDLPLSERPECHQDGTTYTAVYGRMHEGKPAPTITTGFMSPGRGRFIHPSEPRMLTPSEAARIQGFPDWFNFMGACNQEPTRTNLGKWIGDAVPSILGYVAGISALAMRPD